MRMTNIWLTTCSLVVFCSTSFAASHLKVVCDESVSGIHQKAQFDSEIPIFSSTLAVRAESPKEKLYLAENMVCGLPLNFATNCKGEVRTFQGDVGYFFICSDGHNRITGEIVFDADQLTYSCSGANITENFANGFFTGCHPVE